MSEPNSNHSDGRPYDLDLYQEQARQGVMLNVLCGDVTEIKDCLLGREGFHEGLVVEVDRLKRGQRRVTTAGWILFTTLIGTITTVVITLTLGG